LPLLPKFKNAVYVDLADKKAAAVVDPQTLKVTKTYPIENCSAMDAGGFYAEDKLLFESCSEDVITLEVIA